MNGLIRKEWLEHRHVIALLYLLGLIMLAISWEEARTAISPLAAWTLLVVRFGTLAAVVISNRLVVREYGQGTQLFLETLPISRATVFLVKWLCGWCVLMLFMAIGFGLILQFSRHQVDLDRHFIAQLALRPAAFLLLAYATAFVIALTLRFRFIVWGVLVITVLTLDARIQVPAAEWAPFYLVKATMVQERGALPWRELGITVALAVALLAIALALVLSVRGALVIALARRMSARTRTGMALSIGLIVWLLSTLAPRVEPPRFQLAQAVSSSRQPIIHLGWPQPVAGVAPALLVERMSADLDAMRAWLGLDPLPETSLVADAWREPDEFTLAPAGEGQLVLRAALGDPALALPELQSALRNAHLFEQSAIYRWREDRMLLMSGFALWWGARDDAARMALLQRRADLGAALLRNSSMPLGDVLPRSARVDEQVGSCLADALAWRVVQTLHERLGDARFQGLMRASLAARYPDDIRSLVRVRPIGELLNEAGIAASALDAQVTQAVHPVTEALPTLRVDAEPLGGGLRALRYRISGVPAGHPVAIRYKTLAPTESSVGRDQTRWASAQPDGVLPATFARGGRVLVFAELRDPQAACMVRFGTQRMELP